MHGGLQCPIQWRVPITQIKFVLIVCFLYGAQLVDAISSTIGLSLVMDVVAFIIIK